MFLIYKTDSHHSYASRDLIGMSNNTQLVISICLEQAKKENEELTEDQMFNLININQTQGYSGNGEFHYEHVEQDVLL